MVSLIMLYLPLTVLLLHQHHADEGMLIRKARKLLHALHEVRLVRGQMIQQHGDKKAAGDNLTVVLQLIVDVHGLGDIFLHLAPLHRETVEAKVEKVENVAATLSFVRGLE